MWSFFLETWTLALASHTYKHLYLWSDHRTKGARTLKSVLIIFSLTRELMTTFNAFKFLYIYIYKVDDMIVYVLTIVRDLSWGWGAMAPPSIFEKKNISI